ncbi:hypothetical protein MPER_07273 [Moniliophthora perniciosa FA553]|nr:hypothetical protein MPER_07273 [Moniliophthora perniciosa FA553]
MQITNTIGDIVIDPQLLYECSATAHKEPNANHGVDEAPKEPNTAQHTPQERLSPQATSRGSSFTFVNYNIDNVTFGMSESSDSEGDSSSASDAPKNRKRLGRSKMRRQTSSKTGDKKRVRISGKNAPHGFVDGAFRGAIPWKVPRRRPVEAFEPSRELRNKAYTEPHIPTYNHEFAHFASSPLIRDADRAMDDIHALHSNMHKSLSQATIRDVAKAEMEAAKARAEMRAAKESENVARQNVVDLQQSIEERDQVIAHLRAVLAGAGNGPAM